MAQSRLYVVDGGIRHAAFIQQLEPFLGRLRSRFRFDQRLQGHPVGDADAVGVETLLRLPLGLAELVAQDAEQAIVATAE